MYLKNRFPRQISQFLSSTLKRYHLVKCRKSVILCSSSNSSSGRGLFNCEFYNGLTVDRGFHSQSYFQVSNNAPQVSDESALPSANQILSFIRTTFNDYQGRSHCWLNMAEGVKDCFKKDGTFLVIVGNLVRSSEIGSILEKTRTLQKRFPQLRVIGFHCGSLVDFVADQTLLVELTMKEYITFPILRPKKNFLEMQHGLCFILCKDLRKPGSYHEDLDLGVLSKAIEEIQSQHNGNLDHGKSTKNNLKCTWAKQDEVIKEPELPSPLRNLLLYYPGCVSANETGDRLFLSDINHHRIIISDGNGKIIDSIGSGPGFEDGEFESAKLLRPAATCYDDAEKCLYIVDSENKAIRRADFGRQVLETLYPTYSISKNSNMWTWILDKIGFAGNSTKSKETESQMLAFPWHLVKSTDDDLLILNRSCETLWIMDLASGKIKEVIEEFPKILEICGDLIEEKVSLLKQIPKDWVQLQNIPNHCPNELPFSSHISSIATFRDHIVVCDTIEQRVLMVNRESGNCSKLQLSNFKILGLPYWASFPLEKVYPESPSNRGHIDHLQSFSLLPGQVDIKVHIEIPADVELAEPLDEGCVWRQARGAATEVLEREGAVGTSEKPGVSQVFYDELDHLVLAPESEVAVEESATTSVIDPEDKRIHIDCSLNTSPGTSEVIIFAALYLKLRRDPDVQEENREKYADRIFDILNSGKRSEIERDSCIRFLLKSKGDLRDLVFVKPQHMRMRINSPDHPKAENGRDIIETKSSIDVNVSLQV